jgi:signal peptidase II
MKVKFNGKIIERMRERLSGAFFSMSRPSPGAVRAASLRCLQGMTKYGMTKNSARMMYLLIALIVVVLDRWTKHVVAQRISLYSHIQVIPGFFRLTHTENTGAAFSLFADSTAPWKTVLLIGFSVIALAVVSILLWKNNHARMVTGIGLSLIMGGAVGNLWDRVARGRVVDFLLFYVKRYQWPVFNLADSAIVVGAGLLVIEILFAKTHSEASSSKACWPPRFD